MRIGKTKFRLGTIADKFAGYRAQRGEKEGIQGFLLEISRYLLKVLGKPGMRSFNQSASRNDQQALRL